MGEENYVSLKEYVDTRLEAIELATTIARNSMNLRLDGMNEFRESLKDQAARNVSREELAAMLETLKKDRASNNSFVLALIVGIGGLIFGGLGFLIALTQFIMRLAGM